MKRLSLLVTSLFFILILSSCGKESFQPLLTKQPVLLVFNQGDHTLSFIERSSFQEITRWQWKEAITGGLLFPDQDHLLLYGKDLSYIMIYSLSTGEEITRWPVGTGITNAALSHDGTTIYLTDHEKNSLRFFSLEGHEIKELQGGERPYTLLVGPDYLFVYHFYDDMIGRVNLTEMNYDQTFPSSPFPFGGLYRIDENELWVGGHGAGSEVEEAVTIFNTIDGSIKTTIQTPYMPIAFAEWGDFVYVLSHGTSTLYQVDAESKRVVNSLQVGSNSSSLIADHEYLYVTSLDSNELYVIHPSKLQIENTIQVGKQPFQLILREEDES
ncbi:YncE family protein [Rubeoparvulum massiliense]|uniref:YncE family protein n=1 Tax=Rubeoparvulum massiliense TaxID=1631346 RepID=UPI001E45FF37|nr:hypothetical protein [Rubeoparvulum massiliense]